MKSDILPFQIGLEYEDLEFDLEVLPDRIKGYDSYIYVGKEVKYFLNYPTDKVELIFHWDLLVAVIITIENLNLKLHNLLMVSTHNSFLYKINNCSSDMVLIYGKLEFIADFNF